MQLRCKCDRFVEKLVKLVGYLEYNINYQCKLETRWLAQYEN
jgi:hypothetical protein